MALTILAACAPNEEQVGGTDTGNPVIDVTGQVTNLAGNPVANTQITLHGKSVSQPSALAQGKSASLPEKINTIVTQTDAQGFYHFKCSCSGKAYLVADWENTLGYLDSLQFDSAHDSVGKNIPLQPMGTLEIDKADYPLGTRLYVLQLDLYLIIGQDTAKLTVPPGDYGISVVSDDESVAEPETRKVSSETKDSLDSKTLTDARDLRTYKTVKIGNQTWMAENLNYGVLDTTSSKLQTANQKYCYLGLESYCATDGGLYQWHRAMNLPDSCATKGCAKQISAVHQGICPDGWHMPGPADWDTLAATLGGAEIAGQTMKLNSSGYSTFDSLFNDGNSSGFSAYPAGIRYFKGNYLYHGGESNCGATFWETEEEASTLYANAYRRIVNNLGTALTRAYNHAKADAFSIRCVKND